MLVGWVIIEMKWSSTIKINIQCPFENSLDLKLLYENITTF